MSANKDLADANHNLKEELAMASPAGGQFFEGNAIFTDVEEQRLAMEKELITMKVWLQCCSGQLSSILQINYSALQANYEIAVKQRQQLRSQVQMLMQMSGSEADSAMLRRTEENYSQLKAELNQLATKYLQLQKKDSKIDGQHTSVFFVTLLTFFSVDFIRHARQFFIGGEGSH
jgi:hypothetical protein